MAQSARLRQWGRYRRCRRHRSLEIRNLEGAKNCSAMPAGFG
ncbi:MAG: hypothetical protein PUP92_10975 [Rhizonema sp. PD38]|nr:hypothetical protein [Rhizonema sp. PD38]